MQERQTKQKQLVYEALKQLNHPTATEVFGWVQSAQGAVSRATVFRVLGGFVASGQALELRFAGNEVRYDYNTHRHYHARCKKCGRVADVSLPTEILTDKLDAEAMDGFEIENCVVDFYGKCRDCKKQEIC